MGSFLTAPAAEKVIDSVDSVQSIAVARGASTTTQRSAIPYQWHLNALSLVPGPGFAASHYLVAVLDTGVDPDDLRASMLESDTATGRTTGVGVTMEGQRDNLPDADLDSETITAIARSVTWR